MKTKLMAMLAVLLVLATAVFATDYNVQYYKIDPATLDYDVIADIVTNSTVNVTLPDTPMGIIVADGNVTTGDNISFFIGTSDSDRNVNKPNLTIYARNITDFNPLRWSNYSIGIQSTNKYLVRRAYAFEFSPAVNGSLFVGLYFDPATVLDEDNLLLIKAPYNFTTGKPDYTKRVVYTQTDPTNQLVVFSDFAYFYTNSTSVFMLVEDTKPNDPPYLIQQTGMCGNNIIEGTEECDGTKLNGETCVSQHYTSGTLSCSNQCEFNYANCQSAIACDNDNIAEGSEQCDGTDLNGVTCASKGYTGGTPSCTSACKISTSSCTGKKSSGGGGGGGGGGSGGAPFLSNPSVSPYAIVNDALFSASLTPVTILMYTGSSQKFIANGEIHKLVLKRVSADYAEFDIFTNDTLDISFTLNLNESREFDLDENGFKELKLTLSELTFNKAKVTFERQNNGITGAVTETPTTIEPVPVAPETTGGAVIPEPEAISYEEQPAPSSAFPWTYAIIGLTAVALLFGSGAFALRMINKKKQTAEIAQENVNYLSNYVQETLNSGFTKEQVRETLLNAGWDQQTVDSELSRYPDNPQMENYGPQT